MGETEELRRRHKERGCKWPSEHCNYPKEDFVHCTCHIKLPCQYCEDRKLHSEYEQI